MANTDVLRGVPLFQGMTDRSVEVVAELARPQHFDAGQALTTEGEAGATFIVLTAGTADVEQGGDRIGTLKAGDYLGEISLIDGGPRTATVVATSPIDGLVIECDGFQRLMTEFPGVRLDVVTSLAHRLRSRSSATSD